MSWESGFTGGPVAGETSSSVAARLIRQGIITGELPPGQALRETELARQMGISRTPIREALRLLQNDGLVEFTPNRGASVKAYSAADLQDVYNLRAALEGYAAQTAAQHITDQQLEALHDSCERYEGLRSSSENLSLLAEENLVFHNTILAAAGSQRLSAMVRQVTALPLIYKSYLTYSPENRRTAEEHHRAILAALERRRGDEARGMLEDHILWARDLAIAHLALAPAGAEIDGQPQLGGAPAVRNALTVASQGGGWRHPCEIHRLAVRRAQRLARRQPHPPKHRLLRPRDLEDEDLALFSRASDPFLHEHLLSAIAAAGYRFRSVRDTGCATARDAMLAVASGLGVAFRPFSFRDAGGGRKASSSGASSSRRW